MICERCSAINSGELVVYTGPRVFILGCESCLSDIGRYYREAQERENRAQEECAFLTERLKSLEHLATEIGEFAMNAVRVR